MRSTLIAASLLTRAGRTPVLVDDFDSRMSELGLPLEAA